MLIRLLWTWFDFVWKCVFAQVCACVFAEGPDHHEWIVSHCKQGIIFRAVATTVVVVGPVPLTLSPQRCLQGTVSWRPRSGCSCGPRPRQTPWSRRRMDRPLMTRSTPASTTGSASGSASRSPTPPTPPLLPLPELLMVYRVCGAKGIVFDGQFDLYRRKHPQRKCVFVLVFFNITCNSCTSCHHAVVHVEVGVITIILWGRGQSRDRLILF